MSTKKFQPRRSAFYNTKFQVYTKVLQEKKACFPTLTQTKYKDTGKLLRAQYLITIVENKPKPRNTFFHLTKYKEKQYFLENYWKSFLLKPQEHQLQNQRAINSPPPSSHLLQHMEIYTININHKMETSHSVTNFTVNLGLSRSWQTRGPEKCKDMQSNPHVIKHIYVP